jgi:hypothetical protein
LYAPEDSELIFFAVDNSRGLLDAGVKAYRAMVKRLAETSPTATQNVPLSLLKLQDAIMGLSRKDVGKDTLMMQKVRGVERRLHRLGLKHYAALFEEATGQVVGGNLRHSELRTYLDFFNMMGVVTHSNAAALDHLIVIDPLWLLKQITRIIRDPEQHRLPDVDRMLPGEPKKLLYEKGVLKTVMMKTLWQQETEALQVQLLNLCLQVRRGFGVG